MNTIVLVGISLISFGVILGCLVSRKASTKSKTLKMKTDGKTKGVLYSETETCKEFNFTGFIRGVFNGREV